MTLQERFKNSHPEAYFLSLDEKDSLQRFLIDKHHLDESEEIRYLEKPGEGNMNFVVRIVTSQRSFIIKQARPWVEKYPQIDAPVNRTKVEKQYYQAISEDETTRQFTPDLLWTEDTDLMLALEDLGKASDLGFIYGGTEVLDDALLDQAASYLQALHKMPPPADFPENRDMRVLNHTHIFLFPFDSNNGLDLDVIQKGLSTVAKPFIRNESLKERIRNLGDIYLSRGRSLLHGDFYPGSILQTGQGLKVIDPEFAFVGPPEFDVAIMLSHLIMSQHALSSQQRFAQSYSPEANFNQDLMWQFVGVEIMRRLIGIAQLPLSLSISQKINLLADAHQWITTGVSYDKSFRI